jgi:hypothetical protein
MTDELSSEEFYYVVWGVDVRGKKYALQLDHRRVWDREAFTNGLRSRFGDRFAEVEELTAEEFRLLQRLEDVNGP